MKTLKNVHSLENFTYIRFGLFAGVEIMSNPAEVAAHKARQETLSAVCMVPGCGNVKWRKHTTSVLGTMDNKGNVVFPIDCDKDSVCVCPKHSKQNIEKYFVVATETSCQFLFKKDLATFQEEAADIRKKEGEIRKKLLAEKRMMDDKNENQQRDDDSGDSSIGSSTDIRKNEKKDTKKRKNDEKPKSDDKDGGSPIESPNKTVADGGPPPRKKVMTKVVCFDEILADMEKPILGKWQALFEAWVDNCWQQEWTMEDVRFNMVGAGLHNLVYQPAVMHIITAEFEKRQPKKSSAAEEVVKAEIAEKEAMDAKIARLKAEHDKKEAVVAKAMTDLKRSEQVLKNISGGNYDATSKEEFMQKAAGDVKSVKDLLQEQRKVLNDLLQQHTELQKKRAEQTAKASAK